MIKKELIKKIENISPLKKQCKLTEILDDTTIEWEDTKIIHFAEVFATTLSYDDLIELARNVEDLINDDSFWITRHLLIKILSTKYIEYQSKTEIKLPHEENAEGFHKWLFENHPDNKERENKKND